MKLILRLLPAAFLLLGAVLLTVGLLTQSGATPMGAMDCGCGGGHACVTKQAAVNTGAVLLTAGSSTLVVALITGATFLRPLRQRA